MRTRELVKIFMSYLLWVCAPSAVSGSLYTYFYAPWLNIEKIDRIRRLSFKNDSSKPANFSLGPSWPPQPWPSQVTYGG